MVENKFYKPLCIEECKMSEIIEDFDPQTGNSSGGGGGSSKKNKLSKKINPLLIHIGFLLLLLVLIMVFFLADFSMFEEEDSRPVVTLVGNQENFSLDYQGDLIVETGKYNLETNSGTFDGVSQEFRINNYNGNISLVGEAIIFDGVAKNISFGNNFLKIQGSSFKLNSSKKTAVDFYLDSLNMKFVDGTFKFDEKLTYGFEKATIVLTGANTTMNYDGVFSFKGYVDAFKVDTAENITLSYQE